MKKSWAVLLALPFACYAWACSSSSGGGSSNSDAGFPEGDGGGNPGADGGGGNPGTDGGGGTDSGPQPTGTNPISGIAAPVAVGNDVGGPNGYIDSLRFFNSKLYASDPILSMPATGVQYTIDTAVGTPTIFRQPSNGAAGIAIDTKSTTLVAAEFPPGTDVVRIWPDAGATRIASTWDSGAGPLSPFDSPNDVTVRKSDGTIYFTDPGYQNSATTNHAFRIAPNGVVSAFDTCTDACHPNGIALSPKEDFLYVGYSYSTGTQAVIKKFPVNADGTLGAGVKLTDAGDGVDGLATDDNGNVYAAYITGVAVFAPSGTKWGDIPLPAGLQASSVAFGGTARTTLYIGANNQGTTNGVYSVTVKVPGRVE